jgi:excinuclease UvrABC nuclease subunit
MWRSPVDSRDRARFADWIRELKGKSGAYAIRDAKTREVLYVGSSHTGRLYPTLTRHLQFWKGVGAGPTYNRETVEIRTETTPKEEALDLEEDWIADYLPRHNRQLPEWLTSALSSQDDGNTPF